MLKNLRRFSFYFSVSALIILLLGSSLPIEGILTNLHQDAINIARADTGDPWYGSGWKYRKEIRIDHSMVQGQSFADYPFLFSATDIDLKYTGNGGKAGKSDGTDIVFAAADGTTKLSHEIEEYDPLTGKLAAWVRIPNLSNTADTKLYIYYGNASAADQQDAANVWTSEYKMVQHMDGVASLQDSTANGNDGTKAGVTLSQEIQGKVGKAQNFEGVSTINIADGDSLDFGNNDWTVSFWLKSGSGSAGEVMSKGRSGENSLQVRKTSSNSIWSNITGNGILNYPIYSWGDGTHLYTVDRYNHRVVKTRLSDMSFVAEIKTWTGGVGQFSDPIGVWGDGTRLYVANSNYHRIEVFSLADLSYITFIGSGNPGSGDNDFYYADNTWGDGTYLYILDTYNNRIVKRRADDYSFVAKIGTQGIGNDQFYRPWGIWGDGTYLYVADSSNNRIVKRKCSDLSYVAKIGTSGTGNDQFSRPTGIWGDGTYLYIGDQQNNRIVKRLASTLAYVSQIGGTAAGTGNDQFDHPNGIWGDGTHIYINDSYNNRVIKRLASNLSYVSTFGVGQQGNYISPVGIYNDGTYIYLTDTLNHSVVKRRLSDYSLVAKAGSYGTGNDQFNNPYGIWGDGTYLYITDFSNNRIVKRLASDLSYVSHIGGTAAGTGNDQFNSPYGIWGDGTYLYVADSSNNRIVKRLASNLSYVAQIGSYGSGVDQFYGVRGIWGDGTYLYVVDSYNHRVMKRRASDLSYVSHIGGAPSGNGDDQFYYPAYIWGDGTYLYITDGSNYRIMKRRIDDMSFVSKIGSYGSGNDGMRYILGITESGGYLYIVDNGNLRVVKRLASDLSYYDEFGGSTLEDTSSGIDNNYNYITIIKKNVNGISTLSTYVNGSLSSDTVDRTYSDVGNDKSLVIGHLLSGEIDEFRIVAGGASLNKMTTDYNNQSSPSTFLSILSEEERMDHFLISGASSQLSRESQTLTISAIGSSGSVYSLYSGDYSVVLSGANADTGGVPFWTDKNGSQINFGSSGTLTFVNGVATTQVTLFKAENAGICISDGTYSESVPFGIEVGALGLGFVPPKKPIVTLSDVIEGNMPEDIKEMAISNVPEFAYSSWEIYDNNKLQGLINGERAVYMKFRTTSGAVSDTIIYTPQTSPLSAIQDGDIIQCRNSDNPYAVYIVKTVNNKKYIRHIVSLSIFNHYQHLRWENLKQVDSLESFNLSAWVRVNTGANGQAGPKDRVYEINADQSKHFIDMTAEEFFQHGGSEEAIYNINTGELNLYRQGEAVKVR